MKRITWILSLVLAAGLILNTGCGSKDGIDTDDVNELWEQQILHIDTLLTGLSEAKETRQITEAIDDFSKKLEETIPEFNELLAKYPAFKERMEKEKSENNTLSEKTLAKNEALAKLIVVGLFTENIIKIQENKYKDQADIRDALKKLVTLQGTMKIDEPLKGEAEVGVQYNNLVTGQMTGSPKVQKFFEKLHQASVTSTLKITIRKMIQLGRAIHAYRTERGYAPKVTEIDQLKTYEDFISKYSEGGTPLPLDDGWGNYLYYKTEGNDYWLGSAGSDGRFEGFDQKGMYTDVEGKDVILSNGRFIYYPKLDKNPGENKPSRE